MNHPVDVDYIRKMVPNISDDVVEKQKTLQSGTCLGFGSAFKIPLIVKLKMPDPMPKSGNCDVVTIWNGNRPISNSEPPRETYVQPQPPVTNYQQPTINNNINSATGIPEVRDIKNLAPQTIAFDTSTIGNMNNQTLNVIPPSPVVMPQEPLQNQINFANNQSVPSQATVNVTQPVNITPNPMPSTNSASPIPEVMPGLASDNTNPTVI